MKRIIIIFLSALGIVVAGAAVAVVILDIDLKTVVAQKDKEPSAEELAERSYNTEAITTNLSSDHFAVVQLNLLANNEKSYKELEVRSPEVKAIVISTLADLTKDDLKGNSGLSTFEKAVGSKINKILQDGEIERVLVTDFKIQ